MVDCTVPGLGRFRAGLPAGRLQTIAVCSGKGGVGKTSISINLAVTLAAMGRRVMLLDADLGMANVDVMLGVRPHGHLGHVLNGEMELENIIRTGPEGVALVSGASGLSRLARLNVEECAGLIHAFSTLNRQLDFFIVDVATGIGESAVMFSQAVQQVMVVISDEPASLMDAYAMIKVLSGEYNVQRFQILANMVYDEEQGRTSFNKLATVCHRYLDVSMNYMGAIPRDEFLRKAVSKQKPVTIAYPGSPSSMAFKELAKDTGNPLREPIPSGGIEFFIDRMVSSRGQGLCQV